MVKRGIEQTHLPLCRKERVSVLSYSSLALGLLSGKMGPDRRFEGDDLRKGNRLFSRENLQQVETLMRAIDPIAETHGATRAQVVIAWTLQQPGITFSLCGARTADQARENAAAGRIRFAPAEVDTITAAADRHLSAMAA